MHCKISSKIFAFISESDGSNCYLLKGKKEMALIDSSTPNNNQQILEWLSSLGTKPSEVSLVLHTHGHADHFGNDSEFPKAAIAMHEADAMAVNRQDIDVSCSHFFFGISFPNIKKFLSPKHPIDLGGIRLKVLETPGHTAGSICFFLEKEKTLFSGDTLFVKGIGRADFPGGDSEMLEKSLFSLQKLKIKVLLPGHGEILKGEKENKKNIEACLKMV